MALDWAPRANPVDDAMSSPHYVRRLEPDSARPFCDRSFNSVGTSAGFGSPDA